MLGHVCEMLTITFMQVPKKTEYTHSGNVLCLQCMLYSYSLHFVHNKQHITFPYPIDYYQSNNRGMIPFCSSTTVDYPVHYNSTSQIH